MFYWDKPFLVGWVFSCSVGKKPFSVDLVDQLFQPASNYVVTVEKALTATAVVYAGHLKSAAGFCHVAFGPHLANAEKSGNNYSQELPRFNRTRLKKCSMRMSMGLTVNRQMAKNLTVNRQKPKNFTVNRQTEQANISRQMFQISLNQELKD